jgi:(S)-2-hydroxyglutarate dehydrogenase
MPSALALPSADVAVVGGGIVGLATAYALLGRSPGLRVTVLEKEDRVARHQTGRNSGVLHSGVYYAPGSEKARSCRAGYARMVAFCEAEGLPLELCGKVIVAAGEGELSRLADLEARGQANGVAVDRLSGAELREVEPHATGMAALRVPSAGIVDYGAVARRLAERVEGLGGRLVTDVALRRVRREGGSLRLETSAGPLAAGWLVNCAGLHADRVARLCGETPAVRIVPFRGEYYALRPEARHLCRGLIYPVPDPRFPFLGVHLSRRVDGRVDVGPSAVLAFAREGYGLGTVRPGDFIETLGYSGFRRLARRHLWTGLREVAASASKRLYLRQARRLVPSLTPADLLPAPSGVRAQAVTPEGRLVDDFLFQDGERAVHVLSAASPAATASLHIGETIADRLAARW